MKPHHAQVVGDEDHGGSHVFLDFIEQVEHGRSHGYVQGGHRLIADHQGRPAGQGSGNTDALLFSAGQLPGVPVIVIGIQFDGPQQPLHFIADFSPGNGLEFLNGPADLCSDGVRGIQGGIRVLEHHLKFPDQRQVPFLGRQVQIDAHELHFAVGQFFQADDSLDQGAFAAAGFSDNPQCGALEDLQGNVVNRLDIRFFLHAQDRPQ